MDVRHRDEPQFPLAVEHHVVIRASALLGVRGLHGIGVNGVRIAEEDGPG